MAKLVERLEKTSTAYGMETSAEKTKKGNLQQCQNYRKISLISHPSKVILTIILNRLKPQAETIIAEE